MKWQRYRSPPGFPLLITKGADSDLFHRSLSWVGSESRPTTAFLGAHLCLPSPSPQNTQKRSSSRKKSYVALSNSWPRIHRLVTQSHHMCYTKIKGRRFINGFSWLRESREAVCHMVVIFNTSKNSSDILPLRSKLYGPFSWMWVCLWLTRNWEHEAALTSKARPE